MSLSNCILWENVTGSWENNIQLYDPSSNAHKVAISHSIIGNAYPSGVWNGNIGSDEGGNLGTDPLFTDPANGDYSLFQCSPAIDAGINDSIPAGITTDLAGNPRRYNNGTVDMGAYEYQGAFVACCPTTVFVDSAATGANDGSSWADAYTDLQDAIDLVANSCPGVEIWVAKGTYFPSRDQTGNASPSDPRDKTFYINTDGTQLYGGFAGTETDKSQRVAGNETILSGDIGIAGDSTDNCYTVVCIWMDRIVAQASAPIPGSVVLRSWKAMQMGRLPLLAKEGAEAWFWMPEMASVAPPFRIVHLKTTMLKEEERCMFMDSSALAVRKSLTAYFRTMRPVILVGLSIFLQALPMPSMTLG
jgi:hypothetical protein